MVVRGVELALVVGGGARLKLGLRQIRMGRIETLIRLPRIVTIR